MKIGSGGRREAQTVVDVGTDANRNWGYQWNTGGSSPDPCSDTYMGSEAFSEVENRNVRDFLWEHKDNIKFYNTLHSYSQLVLLPWGWGYEQPDNIDDLEEVGLLGADALKAVHGKTYEVGCIPAFYIQPVGAALTGPWEKLAYLTVTGWS